MGGMLEYDYGVFDCDNLTMVMIGDGTESIGIYAFRGCYALKNILIPESVTEIDDTAFDNIEQAFTIYTTEGSYADTFAQEKGFNVRYYDKETKDNEGYDLLDIAVESGGEDEAAKSFTLTCNIRNNFVMEDTPVGTLVTAFYDENGCMVDAVIDDEYLNGLADTSWLDVSQYSRTINTDKNVSYAKAFIWEDSQSMVPLDEAVSSEAA